MAGPARFHSPRHPAARTRGFERSRKAQGIQVS